MSGQQPNNPLHGITLEAILNELVSQYGWDELGRQIEIRCFTHEPSIASSLKFLRRTRRLHHLLVARIHATVADVLQRIGGEDYRILRDDGDVLAQVVQAQFADVLAVDPDAAAGH
ncbi:MAG: hypothetical protein CVU28_15025, partial [Betaproteobacteria bacterium HGW-Betaproteobacteria-21]